MKDWADLPVSAQVKRTRGVLADVLPQWGLGKAELRFIFHGENTTFRAHTNRADFLVRVARPNYRTISEAESELHWLTDLCAETGLCPQPVKTRDGQFVVKLSAKHVFASHVCVFRWMDGVVVGRHMSAATLRETGEMMARLHEHAAFWKPPKSFDRPGWQRMANAEGSKENEATWKLLPPEHQREFRAIGRKAVAAYEKLSRRGDIGLLHADLHRRNVLRTKGGLAAIDFDDCGFAPWVTDLAVAAAYWNKDQRKRFQWMLEGYQRVREFPPHQLQDLSLLIAWRLAGVCLWATARAQNNATFRATLSETQDALLRLARGALDRHYV